MKTLLEAADDSGGEEQREAILSTDNQTMLRGARDFDQADKSCSKVGLGVFMPSGFVGCNVTPPLWSYINIYMHESGNSISGHISTLRQRRLSNTSQYCRLQGPQVLREGNLFSLLGRRSPGGWLGNKIVVKGVVSHER